MIQSLHSAIEGKDFVLGKEFSMADIIFGGTVRYMLMVKSIEPTPVLSGYMERLSARPGCKRADEKNAALVKEHGLDKK